MIVNWSDSETRQTAIDDRTQAIQERNQEAVELFNHNRRLGRVATLDMVRVAVLRGGCDRSIVYDILSSISMWGTTVSFDCDDLDEWSKARTAEGDPRGAWLAKEFEELRRTSEIRSANKHLGAGNKRLVCGKLDRDTGNYNGGTDDQLIVNQHKWKQVSKHHFFI